MTAASGRKGTTIEADYVWVSEKETFREKAVRWSGNAWRWIVIWWTRLVRFVFWLFSSAIRWLFLTVMFVYLFTLTLALFEADSFQGLVGTLAVQADDPRAKAGTARTREIIQMVREQDRKKTDLQNEAVFERRKEQLAAQAEQDGQNGQNSGDGGGSTLGAGGAGTDAEQAGQFVPDAEKDGLSTLRQYVASELDELHATINGISSISGAEVPVVFKTSEEGRGKARERFAVLVSKLQDSVQELKDKVGEADEVTKALIDLNEVTERLQDYEFEQIVEKPTDDIDAHVDEILAVLTKEGEDFKKDIETAGAMAKVLMESIREDHNSETTPDAFKGLEEGLDTLRRLQLQAGRQFGFEIISKREREDKKRDDGDKDQIPDPTPLGKLILNRSNGEKIGELRTILAAIDAKYAATPENSAEKNTYEETLRRALILFQTEKIGDADENVGPGTVEALTKALPAPEPADPQKDKQSDDKEKKTPEQLAEEKFAKDAGEARKQLETAVADLQAAFLTLKDSGIAKSDDVRQLRALTGPISSMEAVADALDRVEVVVDIPSGALGASTAKIVEKQKAAGATLNDASKRLESLYKKLNEAFEKNQQNDDSLSIFMIADAIGFDDERATAKATQIWHEYQSMERFQPILTPFAILRGPGGGYACERYLSAWERFKCAALGLGFQAKQVAVWPRQNLDLMVVFVLGAIGSLIYITQRQLREIISGRGIKGIGPTEYFSWYFFRPIFGIVIAFAIYLLYKTGAGALGASTESVLAEEVNLPMLALIALFAGLLSWQALEVVETRGRNWLKSQRRENLYATGLEAALRGAGQASSELAAQIGRTPIQIDRWIACQDKVTPEMQDRIATWLNRQTAELFSDQQVAETDKSKMRWATGLKRALDNSETSMDVEQLAVLLEKDPETVHAWKELHRQVDPKSQLLIAETLRMRPAELFDQVRPDQDWWAHGLRMGLESSTSSIKNSQDLAAKVGSSPENVRRYMELATPVPKSVRDEISNALDMTHSQLFTPNRPMVKDFLWAAGLRYAMQESEKYKRSAQLAEAIDADLFKVRSWMEMEVCESEDRPPYCGQVAPATRKRIALALGVSADKLFATERAEREFLWAVAPDFQQAVESHGGTFELAERIDVDQSRLQRWIDGAEPIAPATRARIKRELGIPLEDESLFEWRKPGSEKAVPAEGTWWGAMLRDGLRRRGKRVADLAGEIGITEDALHGYIELEQEVPKPIREKIARQLSFENDQLFSKVRPEPSEFRWATNLRNMMMKKGMTDADLALAIDGDVRRIRSWMDLGYEDPIDIWNDGKGSSVKLGQVAPDTQQRLAAVLGCEVNDLFSMFDTEPPKDTELRWVVQPSFRIAVDGFGGGRSAFLRQAGIDEERLARWLSWQVQVREPVWRRVNELFGLPEESSELFSSEQKIVEAQG